MEYRIFTPHWGALDTLVPTTFHLTWHSGCSYGRAVLLCPLLLIFFFFSECLKIIMLYIRKCWYRCQFLECLVTSMEGFLFSYTFLYTSFYHSCYEAQIECNIKCGIIWETTLSLLRHPSEGHGTDLMTCPTKCLFSMGVPVFEAIVFCVWYEDLISESASTYSWPSCLFFIFLRHCCGKEQF